LVAAGSFQTFIDAGKAYRALGYSVIPVNAAADPSRPKVAAIEWGRYQHERAIPLDFARWFGVNGFAGLAIVTGAISALCVLDFDNEILQQAFEQEYPDLVATKTVLTRRGCHFYYAISSSLHITSRKIAGADLLGEGRYVVAPPTVIDSYCYHTIRDCVPKLITEQHLDQIKAFFEKQDRKRTTMALHSSYIHSLCITLEVGGKRQEKALALDYEPSTEPQRRLPDPLSAGDLRTTYQHLVIKFGRNEALFRVAIMARDHGWSVTEVNRALLDLHAQQPPLGQHHKETPKHRYSEGVRTVQSAFSRPARPQSKFSQLYNSLREWFLQLKQTFVVRVIEALRLAGIEPGQPFDTAQAWKLLKGVVGRDSLYKALKVKTPEGQSIFDPSPRPPTHEASASPLPTGNNQTADVCLTKSGIIPRGRKIRRFIMPDNRMLCALLGVKASGSDLISQEDVGSAKLTRQAIHRELIKRRPGAYSCAWLSQRLGVSQMTLRRYNQQIEALHVVPTYTQTTLGWWNLSALPPAEWLEPGIFLEDSTGRRFPALKPIAMKLLAKGRGVKLLTQTANYYFYGEVNQPPLTGRAAQLQSDWQIKVVEQAKTETTVPTLQQRIERFIRTVKPVRLTEDQKPNPHTPLRGQAESRAGKGESQRPPSAGYRSHRQSRRRYWTPLEDSVQEGWAMKVYQQVNEQTVKAEEKLSLATARKLIEQYGEALVREGLAAMEKRVGVYKPAGWLYAWLRSTGKFR
jgi:hypothetical protein